jgi:hypothetical protein
MMEYNIINIMIINGILKKILKKFKNTIIIKINGVKKIIFH